MVEPSESARRIESLFRRFRVDLEGDLGKADILMQKKAMGMALPLFVSRFREELESAEMSVNQMRILKLKAKQLEDIGEYMSALSPGEQFENEDLGLIATFMETTIALLSAILGREYREGE